MLLHDDIAIERSLLPAISDLPHSLPYSISEILGLRIPNLAPLDQSIMKFILLLGRDHIIGIEGIDHIQRADPFILVANHSQSLEALLLPVWLAYFRSGKLIHFMADWNFRLIPGISLIMRRGMTIPVAIKPARPKVLTRFRKHFTGTLHGFELAKKRIEEGTSVGIFPEGIINNNPRSLLRGHLGAAKLSLETGAPLIPLGIRFPLHDRSHPIPFNAKVEIEIGSPIHPPQSEHKEVFRDRDVRDLHAIMMQHLAHLSGKHWNPQIARRSSHVISKKT